MEEGKDLVQGVRDRGTEPRAAGRAWQPPTARVLQTVADTAQVYYRPTATAEHGPATGTDVHF
jgi:hypothetical protein